MRAVSFMLTNARACIFIARPRAKLCKARYWYMYINAVHMSVRQFVSLYVLRLLCVC